MSPGKSLRAAFEGPFRFREGAHTHASKALEKEIRALPFMSNPCENLGLEWSLVYSIPLAHINFLLKWRLWRGEVKW